MKKNPTFVSAMFSGLLVALCFSIGHAKTENVKAPRGGEIKPINDGFIEVVNGRDSIKIYLYDKNMKAEKKLNDFSIIAEVQRSTSKDHEGLELKPAKDGFTARFEPGAEAKYYLDIGIANRKSGSADRISFDLAPKTATP